jgi:hypothetical protein
MAYLQAQPNASGKVGVIGFCSGGRHAYLVACTLPGIDAAVDCWGGRVIVHDPAADLTPKRPTEVIKLTRRYPVHCSAFSATTTRIRTAPMSTAPKRSSSGSARLTNSIAMMAPATASSRTTAPPTDRSKPWTAGKRFSLSLKNT